MKKLCGALLLAFAWASPAPAQEVLQQYIELPTSYGLTPTEQFIELPQGDFKQSETADQVSKTLTQPISFEYRLSDELPVSVRYRGEARVEASENAVESLASQGTLGFAHRPSIVIEFSKTFITTFALESLSLINQEQQVQWTNRAELITENKFAHGFAMKTVTGAAELSDINGAMRAQHYVRLELEQKMGPLPLRFRLSPSLVEDDLIGDNEDAVLRTGLDSALLWDATARTTLTLGSVVRSDSSDVMAQSSGWHSLYTQLEQKIGTLAQLRLRADYQENTVNQVRDQSAMVFGAETSFSLTKSLRGGFQLQHRVAEMLSSGETLSETILSLSLGGAF